MLLISYITAALCLVTAHHSLQLPRVNTHATTSLHFARDTDVTNDHDLTMLTNVKGHLSICPVIQIHL